jgi:hypothetical protein
MLRNLVVNWAFFTGLHWVLNSYANVSKLGNINPLHFNNYTPNVKRIQVNKDIGSYIH